MAINLLEDDNERKPINLLADDEQELDPLESAKRKIDEQYPGMPEWLKSGLLSLAQKTPHGSLEQAGDIAGHLNNAVEGAGFPSLSRGLLSGMIAPARLGVNAAQFGRQMAGYEPSETLDKLARPLPQAPQGSAPRIPFTNIEIPVAPTAELGGEVLGSIVSGGPVFKGASKALEAAKIPGLIRSPVAGAITGAALSPDTPVTGAALGSATPAVAKLSKFAIEDLPSLVKTLRHPHNTEAAFNKMLKAHDSLDDVSSHLYKHADKLAETRNLQPIKVNGDVIDTARKYLNPDKNYLDLISKAEKGDYKSLTKIQSDMGKRANKLYTNKNTTQAELDQADALVKARKRINDSIDSGVMQQGHHDIASVRNQASRLYADKMQTYFNKNLSPTIRKIFTEGKRLRPGQTEMDLLKPFMERSDSMELFLGKHPELANEVDLARAKKEAIMKLNPLIKGARGTGIGGGMFKAAELLKELF